MRKIKFRIWDNLKEEWVTNKSIWRMKTDDDGVGEIHPPSLYWKQHPEGLTYLQYTGLKDKNGVEIYEGDILEAYGSLMYVVNWCDTYCQYTYSTITNQDGMYTLSLGQVRKDSIVIGNIYENPVLLEQ